MGGAHKCPRETTDIVLTETGTSSQRGSMGGATDIGSCGYPIEQEKNAEPQAKSASTVVDLDTFPRCANKS